MIMQVDPAPLEARRFGLRVGRARLVGDEAPGEVVAALTSSLEDLLVLTVPTGGVLHPALLDVPPLSARVMEVRTTWSGPARLSTGVPDVVEVSSWDPRYEGLVHDIFRDYRNHMSRMRREDSILVASGYAEWARDHMGRSGAACLALGDPDPTALAAVSEIPGDPAAVAVDLAGVACAARGRGQYSRLLDGAEQWAVERGRTTMRISTQADNVAVQRAWARRGWYPEQADWIVHIRPRNT